MSYHAAHKILFLRTVADNQFNTDEAFALPGHTVASLQGIDAIAFAQAQFANDVAVLPVGHWQWNCWLSAKGRIIALFALIKLDGNSLLLMLPDYPAGLLVEQLRKFVFRKKVRIEAREDLSISASFAAPAQAISARFARFDDAIELDFGGDGGSRTLRIGTRSAAKDDDAAATWFRFDLAHGLPHLPESQREHWTPQQLSLERLPAFSVKKGCYPGQEIVARTHFLGKAKRGLVAVCAAATIAPGADVELDGAIIGKIVSTTPGTPCLALAVLPQERGPGALTAGGVGLDGIDLRDGLRR